jgi:hypothetical protein
LSQSDSSGRATSKIAAESFCFSALLVLIALRAQSIQTRMP